MATDPSTGLQGIDPNAWEELARAASKLKKDDEPDTTAEELKQLYIADAQYAEDHPEKGPRIITSPPAGSDDEWPWEFKILGPLSVYGGIVFKSDSHGWTAKAGVGLKLSGKSVWFEGFSLSTKMRSISWNPSLWVVRGNLTVGIRGDNNCLFAKGEGCYWWGSWHCAGFDETLKCFS
ncbi:hypothetical protein [Streptomyces sp. I05A-00742]|uniref:hypothetical protein n=1 Tax=Streptomyces sp. I05A-00742 TaxID=2732853 RepID=UPI0014879FB8|nr:hypothetical protein [Streptomyces sp. I05A-00742]